MNYSSRVYASNPAQTKHSSNGLSCFPRTERHAAERSRHLPHPQSSYSAFALSLFAATEMSASLVAHVPERAGRYKSCIRPSRQRALRADRPDNLQGLRRFDRLSNGSKYFAVLSDRPGSGGDKAAAAFTAAFVATWRRGACSLLRGLRRGSGWRRRKPGGGVAVDAQRRGW